MEFDHPDERNSEKDSWWSFSESLSLDSEDDFCSRVRSSLKSSLDSEDDFQSGC